MCPICFWLQLWRPLTVALNFFASVSKGQLERSTLDQAASTASWNPSCLVQNDSKWNLALVGWTSFSPSRSGQWSDPSVAVLYSKQLGYNWSHSNEQSALSSLTKVGISCWFDHVNLCPCSGRSLSSRSLIKRRNLPIIALLTFPLFFS